jgi:hypothetical protein
MQLLSEKPLTNATPPYTMTLFKPYLKNLALDEFLRHPDNKKGARIIGRLIYNIQKILITLLARSRIGNIGALEPIHSELTKICYVNITVAVNIAD